MGLLKSTRRGLPPPFSTTNGLRSEVKGVGGGPPFIHQDGTKVNRENWAVESTRERLSDAAR